MQGTSPGCRIREEIKKFSELKVFSTKKKFGPAVTSPAIPVHVGNVNKFLYRQGVSGMAFDCFFPERRAVLSPEKRVLGAIFRPLSGCS